MSVNGPAKARMEVCVDNMVVPMFIGTHVADDGAFQNREYLEFKQREVNRPNHLDPAKWIWSHFGYNAKEAYSSKPYSLKCFQEWKDALKKLRKQICHMTSTWKGPDGTLLGTTVSLQIRGRTLMVENNQVILRIIVNDSEAPGDKLEIINWVFGKLWIDRQRQILENNAPQDLKRPRGSRQEGIAPFTEEKNVIWDQQFKRIADHKAARLVTFDWKDRKYRVVTHYRPKTLIIPTSLHLSF